MGKTIDRSEMLKKMRQRMLERSGRKQRDPNEWRPPEAKDGEEPKQLKYFVLPQLFEGDPCADNLGTPGGSAATRGMDLWYIPVGSHWIRNKSHQCPRAHEDADQCPLCEYGFELFDGVTDKDRRKEIARLYLSRGLYAVNIYFPDDPTNPEELRDTVKWYAQPKTIFDIMYETFIKTDDGGDPDNLKAYGDFYWTGSEDFGDEKNEGGYPFILEITRQGGFNSYKTSKFAATRRPIAINKDGSADVAKIEEILSRRHDLYTKYPARDLEKLETLVKEIKNEGEPESSGFDGEEETTATSNPAPAKVEEKPVTPAKTETKAEAAPAEPAAPAASDDVSDSDLADLLGKLQTEQAS